MGFLSGLFHSRDKPTNSTNGDVYRFLFGGSNSGKAVNERSAMQMTAVYACVRILSESIAGLPVHVYKYTDSGSKEKAIKHPLYRLIHDEPNPEMTSFVFRETLMTHLLLYGNTYAQIIRNGKCWLTFTYNFWFYCCYWFRQCPQQPAALYHMLHVEKDCLIYIRSYQMVAAFLMSNFRNGGTYQ